MSGEVAPPVEGTLSSLRAATEGPRVAAERTGAQAGGPDDAGLQTDPASADGQRTRFDAGAEPARSNGAAGGDDPTGVAGVPDAGPGSGPDRRTGVDRPARRDASSFDEYDEFDRPDLDRPDLDRPDFDRPDFDEHEFDQRVFEHRQFDQSDSDQGDSDQGDSDQRDSDQRDSDQRDSDQRDSDQSDSGQHEFGEDYFDDDEIFAPADEFDIDEPETDRSATAVHPVPGDTPARTGEPEDPDDDETPGTVLPLRDHGRGYRDDRPSYPRPVGDGPAGERGYPVDGGRTGSWVGGGRPGGLPDGSQFAVDDDGSTGAAFGLAGAPTGRRVRARLARFNAPWQTPQVSEVLEPLLATHRASHPKADQRLLQRAYDVASAWHAGQYRKSGDQYITHPLAVATILANLGMDTTTLVAALLHDTIEDTDYTIEQMRTDFGGEVALLVDGVTKLDRVKLGDAAKAETIRKMVVAMAKDPRVLVIKLADRLHNMRTLMFLPRAKQEQKARETLEILAPLAHRLGMNTIKWELEDLAFQTLFPKRFEEINRLIGEHAPQREALLRQVTQKVAVDLKAAKIKAEVTGRPKHLYSVYQKMIVRGREFADIYDLVGVRILVDTVRDCYAALGVIHANWQPVPGRFKDYIAMPKFNMYQSLHTTVIGPTGKPVEMQIRTYAMHRTAEYGIAAHWRYKETKGATIAGPPAHIDEMTWLRQLLDWQREASDPSEFLDALRFDLSSQEVYVFTPKGDVIPLPAGSTPVDFAYAVHTEVGHKCIGARVNGKLVPLESTLSNGDVIEIFTSKSDTAGPSQDWLGFVKSPRARTKIRQYFNKERREEAIEAGKEAIVKAMRKQGLPLQRLLTSDALLTIARDHHLVDVSALYAAVGENQLSAQSIVQRLVASFGGEEGAMEDIAETAIPTRPPRHRGAAYDPGVEVRGIDDVWIKLARCCTPVPGDSVFGFVTRSGGVSVHREDCANAEDLRAQPERILDVTWKPTSGSTFLVAIQVEALDRHKLLADITKVLSDEKVNILSATVTTTRDRVAVSRFSFEMADPKHLGHLLAAVRRVDGVYDAYRVTSGA